MRMRVTGSVLAGITCLAMGITTAHAATNQGQGSVIFSGSIIDAPCSITPETADQTVKLGYISNKTLENNGRSIAQKFNVKLEQCDTTTVQSVSAIFTGNSSGTNSDHLAINGSASGAGIVLADGVGKDIKLGQPTDAVKMINGSNSLQFQAYLQGEGTPIVPGDFTATANITLAYQ